MKVISYKSTTGKTYGLLVKEARKFVYVVLMQHPIQIKKLRMTETRYMTDIVYPLNKCKKHLRAAARQWHNELSKPTKLALRNV